MKHLCANCKADPNIQDTQGATPLHRVSYASGVYWLEHWHGWTAGEVAGMGNWLEHWHGWTAGEVAGMGDWLEHFVLGYVSVNNDCTLIQK